MQRAFVDRLRSRGVLTGESVRGNFTPFLIPVGGPLRRPGRGRVLLAGDAGGFVNAFTAEGIYYAMVSGDLAARTIADAAVDRQADLAVRYRRACDREVGQELRDSVLIQRYLFRNPRRIARLVENVWNVYLRTDDVDAFYAEMTERGTAIDYSLCNQPWGMREFGVQDPDGHDFGFGQPIA